MPTNWRQYKLASKDLSISFPKHPTVVYSSDPCSKSETYFYAAYANDVVYSAAIVSKEKKKVDRSFCRSITDFGPQVMNNRVKEITEKKGMSQSDRRFLHGKAVVPITGETDRFLVLDDLKNDRFIELSISADRHRVIDEKIFFDTIAFNPLNDAVDAKGGAVATIGDSDLADSDESFWAGIKLNELIYPLRVVYKVTPRYTDVARQRDTQGTVVLRVTFLSNGSIGAIDVIKGLPNGLTENAIDAARRIVFLPKKERGISRSVTRQVEYSFSIY